MSPLRIAIITGSTRPGRNNEAVARWVHHLAGQRTDAKFELVDIAQYNRPLSAEDAEAPIDPFILLLRGI
jgi:NAD(P)H-dependent FMN reductase